MWVDPQSSYEKFGWGPSRSKQTLTDWNRQCRHGDHQVVDGRELHYWSAVLHYVPVSFDTELLPSGLRDSSVAWAGGINPVH